MASTSLLRHRRTSTWLLGILCWFVVSAASPGAHAAPLTAPTSSEVAQTAEAGALVFDATQQSRTLQEAFELIMGRFVDLPSSATLLRAGWERMAKEAGDRGAPQPGPAPPFTGNAEADVAAFRGALAAYLAREPRMPEGYVAGHSAIRGMAMLINEGHTYFFDPAQYREHVAWTRGDVRYTGIGTRMRRDDLTVIEVFPDTPAEGAGLRPGDTILEVDGKSVEGLSPEQRVGLIRGPEGSWVELLIQGHGEGEPIKVRIQRRQITLEFVGSRMLDHGVGYISLQGFPEHRVADQFEAALANLSENGAQALVLDLRGNGGGRLDVGNRLLNHFVPAGTNLYQQVERSGRQQTRAAQGSSEYTLPVVVLVDGGTASMGEIFASAVQENERATVIGTRTAGSVAAAQVFPLGDGSALQVTIMEIRSGSGQKLNGIGVMPDELVEGTAASTRDGTDPVIARAVEILVAQLQPEVATVEAPSLDPVLLAS